VRTGYWLIIAVLSLGLATGCAGRSPTPAPAPAVDQGEAALKSGEQQQSLKCDAGQEHWRAQGQPKRGGTFTTYNVPVHMDFTAPPSRRLVPQVYEGLVRPRGCFPEDSVMVAGLARAWQVSPDGRTWTFQLRQDVKWHNKPPVNGRGFTAADVAWTIDHQKAGGDLRPWWAPVTHEQPDPYTVVLKLPDYDADFLSRLGYHGNVVVPREVKEQHGDFKAVAVGTGPFMVKDFATSQRLVLERHPGYYVNGADGRPLPYIDGYQATRIADLAGQVAAFRTGQISATTSFGFPKTEADQIERANPKDRKHELVLGSFIGLMFHTQKAPFTDATVRKAVALAIDGDAIIQGPERGAALRVGYVHPLARDYAWSQDKIRQRIKRDPEQARQLLARAGYTAARPLEFELKIGFAAVQEGAEVVQKQLEEVGIKPRLVMNDNPAGGFAPMSQGDYVALWGAPNNNPMPSYWANDLVRTGGSVNYWRFSDPRVDALAIAQGKELNAQRRKQTIDELQDLLVELAPFLPLYDRITFQFYNCQLRNMRPPIPHPDFEGIQEAWIDSSGC